MARFAAEFVRPRAPRMAAGESAEDLDPHHYLREAAEDGLAALLIPEAHGGAGAGHTAFAEFIETVARECASAAVFLDVHGSVACEPLLLFGSESQKREYLPRIASGEWLAGFCLTEAGSGSDAAAMQTRAVKAGDGYVINGSKSFITSSGLADIHIVFARTSEERSGISAFIVLKTDPGIEFGVPLAKMGLRGSRTAEVIFKDLHIPRERLLGEEGTGFRIAMATLDSGRIGISAQAVGIAQGALDAVRAHFGERDDAMNTQLVAEMEARTTAARALTRHAAEVADRGGPVTHAASVAKLFATDTCMFVAEKAVDLCAPESATEFHPAAIRFRDAKAAQIYEGTNQVQRLVIARTLLKS